ncbi:MAG: AAA family ATPase, partial [candidate division WOR-3 bacterium]
MELFHQGPFLSPLAERLRPKDLDEIVGQEHLLGKDKPFRKVIEKGEIFSMIFWGPPGSGKTTLALLIAKYANAHFISFSAVTSGVGDIRKVIREANYQEKIYGKRTILFVDEIHRFNKAQQDAFLPYVEKGKIILIGATTENPSFEVIGPLLSRCRVFILNPLGEKEIKIILKRALIREEG